MTLGFTSADDRGRLKAFLRRCQRLGYGAGMAYCSDVQQHL